MYPCELMFAKLLILIIFMMSSKYNFYVMVSIGLKKKPCQVKEKESSYKHSKHFFVLAGFAV
jgi:hypothetical protein